MNCDDCQTAMVAFHFGTAGEERLALEAHLSTCAACLQAFFALKRSLETPDDARPSELARARLRKAVREELGLGFKQRVLVWSVAAAVIFATVGATYWWSTLPQHLPAAHEVVD